MNGHSGLYLRGSNYYFRGKIPAYLHYLAPTKYILHSLKTNNYRKAVIECRKESYKLGIEIELLGNIDMLIKSGRIVLDKSDIDNIIIYKLNQLTEDLENNYDDIMLKQYDKNKTLVFKDIKDDELTQNEKDAQNIEGVFKEYITDLKDKPGTHHNVIKQINKILKDNISLMNDISEIKSTQKELYSAMRGVDKYINDMFNCMENDTNQNTWTHPRVKDCIAIMNAQKSEQCKNNAFKTPWKDVFAEYLLTKKRQSIKQLNEKSLKKEETCIDTCFKLVKKSYVEDLNYKDCKKVSRDIFNLPKKWEEKSLKKGISLEEMLAQENEDHISYSTAKGYLIIFRNFLIYCKKNHYIDTVLYEEVDIPKPKDKHCRAGFSENELIKIFNPKTYPKRISIDRFHNFYIPLIALYSGMRLGEICQLYVSDVVKYGKNLYYFNITDERKDQHLKTKQSKRIVPVHPMLLNMGFLDLIKQAKEKQEERIFYKLKYSVKNHYVNAVSNWFQYYSKKIGIDDPDKVFHSFRHTAKQHLRDCGVPQEYQNALCGWKGADTGETSYGGNVPFEKLYEYISMLQYPFLEKTLKKLKKQNKL